ncbi:ATP phosphoribosyltransferase regulatory subunit [Caminicella sporogenes DSM 14501]|uniref:ATP phosphoribosyltransferase regulatory subunit n=1 Tax=Caminicella sporogenes DSM 14501 TaxID=1121266 RepID=A0A1M6S478_9FIRM|nr:ATP phosphoribosyltransferase regulatory subunit [Caminicella sporogenes]RKD27190.1 ATP phosphoribosyltransferase regulatory subunit [Caminicella sporogenes]SHK39481.1 ATP phosphoribosyltransferase regulatory subunit [Caminicella sporogenes DSM 14501]
MILYDDLFPEGLEDIHSEEYEFKEEIIFQVKKVFKSFGYRQILTPTLEYYELYSDSYGTSFKDKMFKLIDNNGKILVLRPDVTIPIARMVAVNYKNVKDFFKFFYVTNVFRLNKFQNGNRREFIQAGIEYIGNSLPECDGEIIAIGIKALLKCGLENFHIDIGQIEFLKSIIDEIKINDYQRTMLCNLIENKNYGDLDEFLDELNISIDIKNLFKILPKLYGSPCEVINKARQLILNEKMKKVLDNLEEVYSILKDYGYDKYILFDLGIAKEIDYYTGIIFKGYVNNFGESVLSGGRYNNLTEKFGTFKPACGLGINIDKLVEVIGMYGIKRKSNCYTDYLVLYKEDFREKAIKLSEVLRSKGFVVESNSYNGDGKNQIKNLTFRNVKEIIEIENNFLKITDMIKNCVSKYSANQFLKLLDNKETVASIH